MGKIVAIRKDKTVSYKDETIEYFEEVSSLSQKEDYQTIIDKIKNATETIRIASTTKVDEKIIDAIHENREVNVYMVLKDFTNAKQTIERFDERRVAIIREVKELENNFILIDNIAYLFINPLDEGKNLISTFDESKASDLNFIFNYYFWNKATQEKLLNDINKPIESPFPPFGLREHNTINVVEENDANYQKRYIPRDKQFDSLIKKEKENYLSDDLNVPLYIDGNSFSVGKFIVKESFSIENSCLLKERKLGDVDSSLNIILRKNEWNKAIQIVEKEEVDLESIESSSIESMNEQKPKDFPKKENIKEIKYCWEVTPPKKPKDASKASLYKEHEKYQKDRDKQEQDKQKNQKLLKEKEKELISVDKKDTKKIKNIESESEKLLINEVLPEPKYPLPKVGVLYKTNKMYFLEIQTYEELEGAKEYCNNFKEDCKITV